MGGRVGVQGCWGKVLFSAIRLWEHPKALVLRCWSLLRCISNELVALRGQSLLEEYMQREEGCGEEVFFAGWLLETAADAPVVVFLLVVRWLL